MSPLSGPSRPTTFIRNCSFIAVSAQASAAAGPANMKSSPCTTHRSCFSRWWKQQGDERPCTKPIWRSSAVKNASHLAGASRVPYRHRRRRAHMPGLRASGGKLT